MAAALNPQDALRFIQPCGPVRANIVPAGETWLHVDGCRLQVAERHRLRDAPYRSGECRDWRKVKTLARREANRERWRLFDPISQR